MTLGLLVTVWDRHTNVTRGGGEIEPVDRTPKISLLIIASKTALHTNDKNLHKFVSIHKDDIVYTITKMNDNI